MMASEFGPWTAMSAVSSDSSKSLHGSAPGAMTRWMKVGDPVLQRRDHGVEVFEAFGTMRNSSSPMR
jgi:hypothetical protein